jgi:hypothetical protein
MPSSDLISGGIMAKQYRLTVDYESARNQLTDGGRNSWCDQRLHQSVSPDSQRGVRTVQFELVELDELVEGLDTLCILLAMDQLRFATAVESIAFSNRHAPDCPGTETVHVLGSAFFNCPDEYPEEVGWFSRLLKWFPDGTKDAWLESVVPRHGRLCWPAGTLILAVRE